MRRATVLFIGMCLAAAGAAQSQDIEFTEDFEIDECSFSDSGRNPFFSLNPGDRLVFEKDEDGELLVLQITVLPERQWITFEAEEGETLHVRTRVVEEREWLDDEIIEVSRNFYARCRQTGDIYYFGEDVDIYVDGMIDNHAGAWRAGRAGALPGIIMPGTFLLGSRYTQEVAPGVALDRAENMAMGLEIETPAGMFEDCVSITETTPLEPGHESPKTYCEEIGLVDDNGALLIEYRLGDDEDSDSGRAPSFRRLADLLRGR